jgi:DNA-binding transcriptional MerR regulator
MDETPRYRIQAVAEMTGVPAATLRAWERRYGLPRPGRSESAYRLYSDRDVAEVRRLLVLQNQGLAPSEAARQVLNESVEPPSEALRGAPHVEYAQTAVERLLQATMAFDEQRLRREIQGALYFGSPASVYDTIFSPVLVEIGRLWVRGECEIAAEHLASRAIGEALAHLVGLLSRAVSGPSVLLACIDEEQHDLPLFGVALHIIEGGWRPIVLGQRNPPSSIARATEALKPAAIGLSMTLPPKSPDVAGLFRAYADASSPRPWFVGGANLETVRPFVEANGGRIITGNASAFRHALSRIQLGSNAS